MCGTKVYTTWQNMVRRCAPDAEHHHRYYDRGIRVCKEWQKFENFYKDMGDCGSLEIDRIDNDDGYYKGNCRWTTKSINGRNRGNMPHSSKFRGVGFNKRLGNWMARINVSGISRYLGSFPTEEEAAKAWNAVAKQYEGFTLNKVT